MELNACKQDDDLIDNCRVMLVALGATSASAGGALVEELTLEHLNEDNLESSDRCEVTIATYNFLPGADPIEIIFHDDQPGGIAPLATWGTSYAESSESAQLVHQGKAKAVGNVHQGKRIVKFWYSRPRRSSPTVRSVATSTGSSWNPVGEKTVTFVDYLSINWPQTVFNVQTKRISLNVY